MKLQAVLTGLWRDRRFLNFWSAQTVSELGDRISELALPLIAVTVLEATPEQVGLLTAAVWLPNLVSLVIGSWVDQRPDKRRLMIFADPARLVVLLTLPITPWEAALGGTVTVPTLGGDVELRIPAGSDSGKRMRLRGRGMPGGTPGDQFVTLQIHAPPAHTEAQRKLYEQMAQEFGESAVRA